MFSLRAFALTHPQVRTKASYTHVVPLVHVNFNASCNHAHILLSLLPDRLSNLIFLTFIHLRTPQMHVASLVHDDVIDQAVSRRDKASVNRVFG